MISEMKTDIEERVSKFKEESDQNSRNIGEQELKNQELRREKESQALKIELQLKELKMLRDEIAQKEE